MSYHVFGIDNNRKSLDKIKIRKVLCFLKATFDFGMLLFRLRTNKNLSLFYTHSSFTKRHGKVHTDVLYNGLLYSNNIVFITYDRFENLDELSGIKVVNLGLIVRLIELINFRQSKLRLQRTLGVWLFLNGVICKRLNGNNVFIPSYSNDLGLSLVFNRYRKNFKLIEVQHTSVINYPPYSIVANVKLVDAFYYRDKNSLDFVKKNIFRNFPVDYHRIEANEKVVLQDNVHRNEILYISSFEYSDVHPTFISYLSQFPNDYYIKVRLHPRQLQSKVNFVRTLAQLGCNFEFQESKDWFEDIGKNCIVVSILSSIVEESVGVGLKTIIVDELGAKRFDYLIDNKLCFFSNKLADIINTQ